MAELFEFYTAGTVAIIGIIEWLKHLNIKNFTKFAPYVSFVLSMVAGVFAAKSFGKMDVWNIFCCCGGLLACVQLGYQAVVESICKAIDNYINGKKSEENKK